MATRLATIVLPLSLALIPFLSACRTVNVSGDYAFDAGKGTGVAVVSLTYAGLPSGFNMFVDMRGVDVDYKNAVPISDLFASADWRCPSSGHPQTMRPADDWPSSSYSRANMSSIPGGAGPAVARAASP